MSNNERIFHIRQLSETLYIRIEKDETVRFIIDSPLDGPVDLEIEVLKVNSAPSEKPATIPGHPNCLVGECIECHNVACAIYQGYEEMP